MEFTIRDVISSITTYNEEDLIFAKKINGKFLSNSEAVVVQLTEEEMELRTNEIAELKCPGFEYFLDAFIVKDMISDFDNSTDKNDLDKRTEIIIHYAEYDA
jgi:hypothetical protein